MREYASNKDLFPPIFHFCDDAEVVAADVEHDIGSNHIGAVERGPQFCEVSPFGIAGGLIPTCQRRPCGGMLFPTDRNADDLLGTGFIDDAVAWAQQRAIADGILTRGEIVRAAHE